MILGIGVDLVQVERMEKALARGERIQRRLFTPGEIAYCQRHTNPAMHFAARFAAKEAGMKAIGTGWRHGVRWQDFEVANLPSGKPTLQFHGIAAEFAARLRVRNVSLSLTHTQQYGMAHVILED